MVEKKALETSDLKSNGPYSPGIEVGNFVFISGQVPDDPDLDVEDQTHQVLEKIKSILSQADLGLEDVVQCQVFIQDMADYGAINSVYESYFSKPRPARTCVGGSIPKGVKLEINAIAVRNNS